jgi:hypothetical protein
MGVRYFMLSDLKYTLNVYKFSCARTHNTYKQICMKLVEMDLGLYKKILILMR